MSARRRPARATRRRFLGVLAAGSAAAIVSPAAYALAQSASTKTAAKPPAAAKPAAPGPAEKSRSETTPAAGAKPAAHIADAKEIEKLKGYVDDSLKALRAYPLPAGSVMAFVFKPVRARRGRKGG